MRKTSRTIRRLPPLARELAKFGNELDRASRRAHRLADQVSDIEYLVGPIRDGKMKVRVNVCSFHEMRGGFDSDCPNCRKVFEEVSADVLSARVLDRLPEGGGK